jgi:hypothetical protein
MRRPPGQGPAAHLRRQPTPPRRARRLRDRPVLPVHRHQMGHRRARRSDPSVHRQTMATARNRAHYNATQAEQLPLDRPELPQPSVTTEAHNVRTPNPWDRSPGVAGPDIVATIARRLALAGYRGRVSPGRTSRAATRIRPTSARYGRRAPPRLSAESRKRSPAPQGASDPAGRAVLRASFSLFLSRGGTGPVPPVRGAGSRAEPGRRR